MIGDFLIGVAPPGRPHLPTIPDFPPNHTGFFSRPYRIFLQEFGGKSGMVYLDVILRTSYQILLPTNHIFSKNKAITWIVLDRSRMFQPIT
jgi:hypothetical protein